MNYLKTLISKNKSRFIDRKFNLDLSYITPRIIAMAFPGTGFYGLIHNDINDVSEFLRERHGENYLVINLSGKKYDYSKFNNNVIEHKLVDHHAPSLESLFDLCYEIHKYLLSDMSNVIVVNCKAGKGRAGTVICCYLLYTGRFKTPDEAFTYYSMKRFYKGEGVTQPSQRRYVEYFYTLLCKQKRFFPYKIKIKSIEIKNFDKTNKNDQYISPFCDFYYNNSDKVTSTTKENYFNQNKVKVKNDTACITDKKFSYFVAGDITIKISINEVLFVKKLGKISFNTAFLDKEQTQITFNANEVDPENLLRKKKVPSEYKIILNIEKCCDCDNTKSFDSLCDKCKEFLKNTKTLLVWEKINRIIDDYTLLETSSKAKEKAKNILFGDIDEDDVDYILSKNKINTNNKLANINTKNNDNKSNIIESGVVYENIGEKEEDENVDDNEESDDSYDESSDLEEEENDEDDDNMKNIKNKKKKNLNDSFDSECRVI